MPRPRDALGSSPPAPPKPSGDARTTPAKEGGTRGRNNVHAPPALRRRSRCAPRGWGRLDLGRPHAARAACRCLGGRGSGASRKTVAGVACTGGSFRRRGLGRSRRGRPRAGGRALDRSDPFRSAWALQAACQGAAAVWYLRLGIGLGRRPDRAEAAARAFARAGRRRRCQPRRPDRRRDLFLRGGVPVDARRAVAPVGGSGARQPGALCPREACPCPERSTPSAGRRARCRPLRGRASASSPLRTTTRSISAPRLCSTLVGTPAAPASRQWAPASISPPLAGRPGSRLEV